MSTYKEQADAVIDFLSTLSKEHPGVAEGFSKPHSSSSEGGKMGSKHKELISLGIAVSIRYEGCIAFHTSVGAQSLFIDNYAAY